jgi:hypothetical protein
MPDDLMTIRGMRDRLGREPTLAEVLDQVKRDHPDERGDVLVERLKIAIAIFRLRQETLGLDEAPKRIRSGRETNISEGHIVAVAALVGVLMIFWGRTAFIDERRNPGEHSQRHRLCHRPRRC